MLWVCACSACQVQVGTQAGSKVETKEKQPESGRYLHSPVGLLRPPVAPAKGRSIGLGTRGKHPLKQWPTTGRNRGPGTILLKPWPATATCSTGYGS